MKKTINYLLLTAIVLLLMNFILSTKNSHLVSKSAIEEYCYSLKGLAPSKHPLQMTCCRTGSSTTSSYGARCTSGQQNCVENDCPSGSSECGTSGQ